MSSNQPAEPAVYRPPRGLRRLVPRSLTSRLIVTTLLLVALVSIVVGAVTTLALRHYLLARLDDQLVAASHRQQEGGPPGLPDSVRGCASMPQGQAIGTIFARFDSTCRAVVILNDADDPQTLTKHDGQLLSELSVSHGPSTIQLSIGPYRVLVDDALGGTSVTGLPTKDVNDTVNSLVLSESAVALGGVALAALVGQALVRRQLAPLRQVAATASNVTRLPLESGKVGVIERVPADLTDPATEVGQVGSALNAMLGHVEMALDTRHESEQRVRQFVADASHELRTPLSTIMGYAELTRRTSADPTAMSHAMSRIQAESGRMSSLVDDLLLLARLDSGRPLQHGDVDISLLLAEAVNDARVVSADHLWRLALPDDPVHVTGDRDRLHQVVANLLTNAIRHTPPGTTVDVSAVGLPRQGDRPHGVQITIHDDGPGLPASLAGKEFARFSRGDSSRTRASGGAGLGLSIVQAIVAAHQGTVEIRSQPGDTSVVSWLPFAPDGAGALGGAPTV